MARRETRAGRRFRSGLAVLAVGCLALLLPATAGATFPGENGRIFFIGRAVEGGVQSGTFDVFSVNPDGTDLVNVTEQPGGTGEGSDPSVSGDGSRVAFTTGSQATSEVWVMNADGSDPEQLTSNSALDQMSGISPDGSRIAFMSTQGGINDFDIWTMDADGSDQAVLADHTGEEYTPEFTPDGESVVMTTEVGMGAYDIGIVPSTGGPFTNITEVTPDNTYYETLPSVSPDGTRVAFTRRTLDLGQGDVLSIGINGTDEQPIATDATDTEAYPAYSPDGTKIAYVIREQEQIVIADVDGSDPAPLPLDSDVVVDPLEPDWAVADTTAPDTKITKKPRKRTEKRRAKFKFESTEQGSSFECKLDRKRFKSCESPRKYKGLKLRKHKFKVRAIDRAGNVDPTPAKAKFRVVEPSA